MNDGNGSERVWTKVVGSAALGAAAMFVLDPEKGARRRAVARDKARSMARRTGEVVGAAKRDAQSRWDGVRAAAVRRLRRAEPAADDVLRERVRARLGRVVSHPRAVRVDTQAGLVTLSGPILAAEEAPLLEATRAVEGVVGIDNRLDKHETAEHVPSLQGGAPRVPRAEPMQDTWTPAFRVGAVATGALVALAGWQRGGFSGFLMLAGGLALATRGAANAPLEELGRGRRGRARAATARSSIDIAAPPDAVFAVWSRYESFPQFMSHVRSVTDLGDGRSHWVVEGPAASDVEWDSRITRMVAGRAIEWQTEPGAAVRHSGSVHFADSPAGTHVTVEMSYGPTAALRYGIAALLGRDPQRALVEDLARMKAFVERESAPRNAQVHGAEPVGLGDASLAPPPLVQPSEADVPSPNAPSPNAPSPNAPSPNGPAPTTSGTPNA